MLPASAPTAASSTCAASDTQASASALRATGVVAGYGDLAIVHGADVAVDAGQIVAIIGPNGAGKSTLLKALVGGARLLSGRVFLGEADVTGKPLEYLARRGLAYIPQVGDIFDALRVRENLDLGGYMLTRNERAQRLEETLTIFPALRSMLKRSAATLSGGERKMLAVARTLMLGATVFLLDEPTAGLSPELTSRVFDEQVATLARHGKAVLIVEQKAEAVLEISNWAYVMVAGEVVMSLPASELRQRADIGEVFLGGALP
ncbi:MAG: ABC transporter ATP-binding protein, partial [Acidimicrobiales bacterium]